MPSNASICIKKCLSYVMNVAIAVKSASNRPNVVKRTLTVTQSNGWLIDGPCVQLFGLYSLVVDGEAASVHASPRRHGLSTLARLVATRKHMSPYSTISIETRRCHISPHPASSLRRSHRIFPLDVGVPLRCVAMHLSVCSCDRTRSTPYGQARINSCSMVMRDQSIYPGSGI